MPVYNGERYLLQAVDSICQQTLGDFEYIVVDDGSTDRSLRLLRERAAKDGRIRIIQASRGGVVAARRRGLQEAGGEYIAVMDADDIAEPRRLELQLAYMESHPEVVAVGSCATMLDEEGNELGDARLPLTHEEIEAAHLRGVDSIFHSAVMMRAEAVRRVGGYREGIMPGEDYDLWLQLGEIGKLANLPELLLKWRRTTSGVTASQQHKQREMNERILKDAWQRRGLPGSPVVPESLMMARTDLYQQWGWMALKSGYVQTARRYARRSVARRPWDAACWRLAYCAMRGR